MSLVKSQVIKKTWKTLNLETVKSELLSLNEIRFRQLKHDLELAMSRGYRPKVETQFRVMNIAVVLLTIIVLVGVITGIGSDITNPKVWILAVLLPLPWFEYLWFCRVVFRDDSGPVPSISLQTPGAFYTIFMLMMAKHEEVFNTLLIVSAFVLAFELCVFFPARHIIRKNFHSMWDEITSDANFVSECKHDVTPSKIRRY